MILFLLGMGLVIGTLTAAFVKEWPRWVYFVYPLGFTISVICTAVGLVIIVR